MTQTLMTAMEQSAIRKISWRLVPFFALMFLSNFLDRIAISFARPNGMTHDLGLTAVQFVLASGIFFIGYILLEVPSNLALYRFGARKWLARIMSNCQTPMRRTLMATCLTRCRFFRGN